MAININPRAYVTGQNFDPMGAFFKGATSTAKLLRQPVLDRQQDTQFASQEQRRQQLIAQENAAAPRRLVEQRQADTVFGQKQTIFQEIQAKKKEYRAALEDYMQSDRDPDKLARLIEMFPKMGKDVPKGREITTEAQAITRESQYAQYSGLIEAGPEYYDQAKQLIQDTYDAAVESDDPLTAAQAKQALAMHDNDPKEAAAMMDILLAQSRANRGKGGSRALSEDARARLLNLRADLQRTTTAERQGGQTKALENRISIEYEKSKAKRMGDLEARYDLEPSLKAKIAGAVNEMDLVSLEKELEMRDKSKVDVDALISAARAEIAIKEQHTKDLNAAKVDLEYKPKIAAVETAAKTLTEASVKMGVEALKSVGAVRSQIANLDNAIRAIDDGAMTGFVEQFFPNIRQSTIELDNARSRLGLDIVGAVTFGALSAGELAIALDTAMPTTLKPKALRVWLLRKRAAQVKYATFLEETAEFLTTPGNTINDWMKQGRQGRGGQAPDVEATNGTVTITSQAEYDALPAGAKYIADGQIRTKGQ